MGFKLDVIVEKEYIDHGHDNIPYYHEEIHITGNGVSDTICLQQGDAVVGMSVWQFKEMMEQIRKTSFWYYANLNNLEGQE